MLKFVKWLGGLLIAVVLLLLLAIIVIPNVIDPNDYRDELAELVNDKTGRDLRLSGDLSISVFPWLGVKTQGLSLSQPVGIDGDMVSVETAQLRVKLLPLLSKRVEVDTVVLESPTIMLVTLKNGLDSFSGLSDSEGADAELEDDSATAAVALVIQGVELTDGKVVIDNRQDDSLLRITNLNLVTGNLIGSSLAEITANAQIIDAEGAEPTSFDFTANAHIDTDTLAVTVKELASKLNQGDLDIDLNLDTLTIKESEAIEAKGLSFSLNGDYPAKVMIPSLTANLESQAMLVQSISATFDNVNAVISDLKVRQFIDQPSATGSLSVPVFDARGLLRTFEVDFSPSDSQALKSVALSADFAGSLDGALIQALVLSIDDTKLTGSGSMVNFEEPKFKFDLNLTELNLDRYLPEESEEGDEVSGGEALVVPMALFKDTNANGSFKATRLIADGVVLTDIDVNVASSDGQVSITPKATLYEGKLGGAIVFTDSGEQSSLRVKNEIDLVQLSPLLNDAIESDMLRGIGTLALDLIVTEINGVQSNEGTIELRAKQGALSGIDVYDIVGKLNTAANLYNRFSPGDQPNSDDAKVQGSKSDNTEFSELLGTFHLKNFLMTNDDLKFTGPGFEITGAGQFDLEKESLDYRVNLVIQETIGNSVGDGIQKLLGPKLSWLGGKQIPIRCNGSFESPVCLPDVKAIYSFYLSSKLNEKKSALLQEKLGITLEEGKKVKTKDIFKQLILKEVIKDDQAADDEQGSTEQGSTEPVREKTKKELRDERKRKLLESIFN